MKGKCPSCGEIFSFPDEDRVNVVLFGNWGKYHHCRPDPLETFEGAVKRAHAIAFYHSLPEEQRPKLLLFEACGKCPECLAKSAQSADDSTG